MKKDKISIYRILAAVMAGIACIAACILIFIFDRNGLSLKESNLSKSDYVRFFDVGQAESILIKSGNYTALIDTGTAEMANNLCEDLQYCGVEKIDVLILTHLHDDHTGGVDKITQIYKVDNLILPTVSIESEELGAAQLAISRVKEGDGEIFQAVSGMNFNVGNFELTVLGCFDRLKSENNRSVFVVAKNKDLKFLFTGDAEKEAEDALLSENLNLKCNVLKVGHHGSSSSSTQEFVKAVSPEYAIISVGEDNIYGHPNNQVISLFENMNIKILRTDLHGNITLYIENGKINPHTER